MKLETRTLRSSFYIMNQTITDHAPLFSENSPFLSSYWPTIDHPFFNVSLWENFDKFMTRVTGGSFIPSQFEFVAGEYPLTTLPAAVGLIAFYYIVIFGGRALLKNYKPFELKTLFQLHNLYLTSISVTLLALMVEQLTPIVYHHGLFYAICDIGAWTQPMVTLYYMNYIVKFLEFTDTLFLVFKHKKLTFLHTYHHGATAFLCYTQLIGATSISWVPITLNLAVHVVMYMYYFLSARGIRVWWKEWVTRFQIVQFVLDIVFIYFAVYQKMVSRYIPWFPHCGKCVGSTEATLAGCAIISSYLVLFIAFYIDIYQKRGTKKSRVIKRAPGGVAAKVNEYINIDISGEPTPSPSPGVQARKRK